MEKIIEIAKGKKRIRNGYVLAFILLLLSYFLTAYANKQLIKQSEIVQHTNKVISDLEAMISKIKDAETGVRGYIITKDLEFLYPYYGSHEMADSLYKVLEEATKDNQQQLGRLQRLKKIYDRRFEILRFSITSFNNNNRIMSDTMRSLQTESKNAMDDIRMTVTMMQREENRLLENRDLQFKKTFNALRVLPIISLILAIFLLIFGFFTYSKESKARGKALGEINIFQRQLKKRIEELNAANTELIKIRSMEKFAATGRIARTIAHEVRNPLTNINLAAEQLKSELEPTDESAGFLFEIISRNSNRINQLISELLNSTKFSELNFNKTSINDLLDEALEEAGDRISMSNMKVTRKYSTDICDVAVDRDKIKIAFLNIIINALEAMDNKPDGQLTIETKGENTKCKILISDNGMGMDEEEMSRLFEPYFTSKATGNGLGLTNTQNIILNHKGDIAVKSKKGEGTTFIITLDWAS